MIMLHATYQYKAGYGPFENGSVRDVCICNELFGGVLVRCGGHFRLIMPVVLKGSRHDIAAAILQHSYMWPQLYLLHLTSNNRALNNDFANYLIEIGRKTV
ncbi:hypothetical protein O9G_005718 [Rozella allomycis CSF55]|uniref:ATP-dependent DNA helicase n=1 Tax=Rozella allomycis (strain CSF55) TaxID=988480 RepID=A0A075AWB5_ROZAC|nr:hypothetical protein O9G_005718 [Rozella allomycis CSF55]|eukprot:EPZ34573.1 hypothetical protein O9G_005718 [Rozella allomycis CSF55]